MKFLVSLYDKFAESQKRLDSEFENAIYENIEELYENGERGKIMLDLNTTNKIPYELIYDAEEYGYTLVQKYYCNTNQMAGVIFQNNETKEYFFLEYYGLDSWDDGCLSDGQDDTTIYKAEKLEFGNHILYNLTKSHDAIFVYDEDGEMEEDEKD
jgi:hypothetical protein